MKLLGEHDSRRLLVIPFAPGIGDMVMMEPLMRAVGRALPDWHLTMVAREYAADLLPAGSCEVVSPSYFVTEAPAPLKPLHRLVPQRLIAWMAEPAMALDLGPFERVLNLFWAWEGHTPFSRWWTPQWPPEPDVPHAIDILASYLEVELGIGIPGPERFPRIEPASDAVSWARGFLKEKGVRPGRPVAGLVPVASDSLKWWDVAKWAEVNDELSSDGWQTLLLAPANHAHAQDIYAACGEKPLWPSATLRQLVALLSLSGVVVGVDTGPLHVASALGVPWVGLFGPTNPDLIGPYDRSRGMPLLANFPRPRPVRTAGWPSRIATPNALLCPGQGAPRSCRPPKCWSRWRLYPPAR